MPEKRRQTRSANRTLRKTRVTWSKAVLPSNPIPIGILRAPSPRNGGHKLIT
jgi:hypothetical protein